MQIKTFKSEISMTKECDQNMNIIIHHYRGHTYKVKLPDRDRKNETVCSEHFSYLYSLDSPEVDILVVFVAQRNILFKSNGYCCFNLSDNAIKIYTCVRYMIIGLVSSLWANTCSKSTMKTVEQSIEVALLSLLPSLIMYLPKGPRH